MKKYLLLLCTCLFVSGHVFANEILISCDLTMEHGSGTEVFKIDEDAKEVTTIEGEKFSVSGVSFTNVSNYGVRYVTTLDDDLIELSVAMTTNSGIVVDITSTINRVTGEYLSVNSRINFDTYGTCKRATHRF
ncbi:MAG: hypothetical protein Q7U04_14345 [Bacteriovorax sp.]|nr:hypothetical protein [Bacteriovorax sp.]